MSGGRVPPEHTAVRSRTLHPPVAHSKTAVVSDLVSVWMTGAVAQLPLHRKPVPIVPVDPAMVNAAWSASAVQSVALGVAPEPPGVAGAVEPLAPGGAAETAFPYASAAMGPS